MSRLKYYDGTQWNYADIQSDQKINVSASAPSSPNTNDFWMDTTNGLLKYYNGSAWCEVNSAVWGNISGDLEDQTDLQTALSAKQDNLPTVVNNRFLHSNEQTGALEWSEVNTAVNGVEFDSGTLFNQIENGVRFFNKFGSTSISDAPSALSTGEFCGWVSGYYSGSSWIRAVCYVTGYTTCNTLYSRAIYNGAWLGSWYTVI